MKGQRWWDPKGMLFWQIVMTVCAWGFVVALHFDNDGLWFQGDAPRHAANGAFWSDFLGRLPTSPRDFAFSYYARYPVISPASYPPVFYLLEAGAYQMFGVSPFVGKGLVLAAVLLASLYLVAWLRRWASEDAGWAGSLFVLQPSILIWGNAVMLNVPSMALGVAALYHWRRWLEHPGSRHLYAVAALATLAVLSYLSVAVVLIVMLAWFVLGAGWGVFRQRWFWIVAGAASVPIGAWLLMTMRWDPHWTTTSSTALSDWPVLWKPAAWSFFARHLPGFVTVPVIVLAAAGLGLGLVVQASRREVAFLSLWIVLAYAWFTAISLKVNKGISIGDLRYALLLVPPIVLLAAIGVVNGLRLVAGAQGAIVGWPRFMPWVAVLALHIGLAATVSVPRVSGFREIVRFVGEVAPSERVFYDGFYNGVFSFYALAADTGFRRGVVLGNKLLYSTKIFEIASSPANVRESLRFRCGCRILVVERQIL